MKGGDPTIKGAFYYGVHTLRDPLGYPSGGSPLIGTVTAGPNCPFLASGKHKDVSYPKGTLLVEGYEEGYCRVCLQMSHMSAGESRTSEACRIITVTPDSSVEMGENHYGFCGRTSTLPE